jgi:hypothetical protein
MDLLSQYLRTVEGAYMDEISESLALLHSIGIKIMEPSNDSGRVFPRTINVTLRGWHKGKVAMKGKGVSEGLTNSGQAYFAREFAPSKGWHKRSRKREVGQI